MGSVPQLVWHSVGSILRRWMLHVGAVCVSFAPWTWREWRKNHMGRCRMLRVDAVCMIHEPRFSLACRKVLWKCNCITAEGNSDFRQFYMLHAWWCAKPYDVVRMRQTLFYWELLINPLLWSVEKRDPWIMAEQANGIYLQSVPRALELARPTVKLQGTCWGWMIQWYSM